MNISQGRGSYKEKTSDTREDEAFIQMHSKTDFKYLRNLFVEVELLITYKVLCLNPKRPAMFH